MLRNLYHLQNGNDGGNSLVPNRYVVHMSNFQPIKYVVIMPTFFWNVSLMPTGLFVHVVVRSIFFL